MLLCSHNEASYGSLGLWEIFFGFHMGAAVCQKNKRLNHNMHFVGITAG